MNKFCNDCGERWGFCQCEDCAHCCETASGRCRECEAPYCDGCLHECAACHQTFCADCIERTPVPNTIFQAQYHCRRCAADAASKEAA